MLQVRPYDFGHDYAITEPWREARGQAQLPPHMFYTSDPENPPTGVVVFDSDTGEDCAAAWLYKDSCGVLCWMAWTVTNPNISAVKSVKAIDIAEDFLESIAKSEGFVYMIGMFKQESLVKHFSTRLGFSQCDTDRGHFMTVKGLV